MHPTRPDGALTLLGAIEELCAFELANGGRISLINRLDRETSGIVIAAKHREAARCLGRAMERREFHKEYRAIVWGWPEADEFAVDGPLLRQGEVGPSAIWVKQRVHPDGKQARTRFEVERRFERATSNGDRFALVRCLPETGRMHQIRAHAQHAGHPIVGDKIYGRDERAYLAFIETGWTIELERRLVLPRQALHASALEWEGNRWECPLPRDLAGMLPPEVRS